MFMDVADCISQPNEARPASPSGSTPHTPEEPTSPIMGGTGSGGVSPGTPGTPQQGMTAPGMTWRRGHSRQTSLGTTRTSPSNRRRSLENTMHLIRDVVDGRDANPDGQLERLAEVISSPTRTKPTDSLA